MSPASQGGLEVERYIGSNLISSCARINSSKNNGKSRKVDGKSALKVNVNQTGGEGYHRHGGNRQSYQNYPTPSMLSPCGCRRNLNVGPIPGQFGTAGWTGVPLISVAEGKQKNQQYQGRSRKVAVEEDATLRTPLSRLAIHTQGVPLILTGKYYNGRKNQNRNNQVRSSRDDFVVRRSNKYKDGHSHGNGVTSDCLSVASDESSGSGHSENCLPRIIKPRKRRKKDRKPSVPSSTESFVKKEIEVKESDIFKSSCDTETETESSPVRKHPQEYDSYVNSVAGSPETPNGAQRDEPSEDELYGPKLHHTFEDVTESESPPYGCLPSSCQCHYCDPSGIWNAPSNFFSSRSESSSLFLTPPPDSNKSFRYFSHPELVLRRSWSGPTPDSFVLGDERQQRLQQSLFELPLRSNSFSYVTKTSKPNNWTTFVKKDRREPSKSEEEKNQAENGNGDDCRKDRRTGKLNSTYGSQCLEVFTEIVTSPNGHRDIEIRFYSTSA